MDYQKFIADSEDFGKDLFKLDFVIKHTHNWYCFLQPFIVDNDEAVCYALTKIEEIYPDLCRVDGRVDNPAFKKLNKAIKNHVPTCLYNLDGLFEQASVRNGVSYERAMSQCFEGINLVRDNLFVDYGARFFIFMTEEQYRVFIDEPCDDFADYCQGVIDLNLHFKNEEGLNLSDYYGNKYLEKVFIKEKK